jgi:hypothetical protein
MPYTQLVEMAPLPAGGAVGLPTDPTVSCVFVFLGAEFVRDYDEGKQLPFFQEIRKKHPSKLRKVTITYAEVIAGTHVLKRLVVSHRWMNPDQPDPDGEQLKAIQEFLRSPAGREIEEVWIDAYCMPQDQPEGSRSDEDTADFKTMLGQVSIRAPHIVPAPPLVSTRARD